MLIQQLQKRLDKGRTDLNALSCTFYFRDPYWSDEFRLVAMSGVKLKEPMYGFVSPDSARSTIVKGQKEIFKTQTRMAQRLRETPVILGSIPEGKRPLFGDFIQREGVHAYARLTHTNHAGEREAILFVNFSKRMKFEAQLKTKIRRFFKELLADFDKIQKELVKQDAIWLTEATKVVTPELSIANIDFYTLDKPDPYFSRIIEAALNALHIKSGTGLGTLHLYNAEDHTLELRGSFGPIQHPDKAERHSVKTGEGIVSWVVLRRKALLIQNIAKSDFRAIHVWLNDDVKSELAVPLEVGGELVGVMCLECTEVDGFLPHHVRSVWYAANRAVIIYQLHQQVSMNRKLLELTWKATSGRIESRTSLDEVATLAKDYLKGSFCAIWRYNSDAERFENWGASYTDFGIPVPKGWTDFVLRSKYPIWIGDIKSESEFSIHHWESNDWIEGVSSKDYPKKLNPETFKKGTQSALGIPINVRDNCIGVAWVMYRRERLECPKPGLMSLALGFAAEAGLVLDSIQRQEGELKDKQKIDFVGEPISSGIQSRWELDDCDLLDAHVISYPFHSKLGGDFYAGKIIDKDTVGILLLDGEGHGIEGSLHMLPLMTAFESFWQSYSTAHVISQLKKTSEVVGVRGSAIYCIFSLINGKRWLSVTPAGHDSLIRFKKDGRGRWVHEYFPESHGQSFGHPIPEPLMDYRVDLSPGDVVVGYTDGVAEEKTAFDANHVSTLVMDVLVQKGDNPKDIAEAIIQGSRKQHSEGFEDDATVFVVRVK